MASIFELIETAKKSDVRNYGDVRISEFLCGCEVLTLSSGEFAFKSICKGHRDEYEKAVGKDFVSKIMKNHNADAG